VGQLCPSSTGVDNKTGVVGSVEKEFYEALNTHRGRLKRPENAEEVPKWTGSGEQSIIIEAEMPGIEIHVWELL
jgi:hypothetical protein